MRIRKTRQNQRLACSAGLGIALLMTGCLVGPVPGSKQIQGAAGAPELKKVDLTFLKTGKTSRDEVVQKLGWANAGIKNDGLFLGRWTSSREWFWFAAGMQTAAGGTWRTAGAHNVLIQFDDKGIVQQVREVPDGKLVQEFRTFIAQRREPPLELSSAVEVNIWHHHVPFSNSEPAYESAGLGLTTDAFVLHEPGNSKHDLRIAPEKIASISSARVFSKSFEPHSPSVIDMTIHFSKKTNLGNKISFEITVSDLFVLVKYLQQVQPGAFPKMKDKGATLAAKSTKTSIQ